MYELLIFKELNMSCPAYERVYTLLLDLEVDTHSGESVTAEAAEKVVNNFNKERSHLNITHDLLRHLYATTLWRTVGVFITSTKNDVLEPSHAWGLAELIYQCLVWVLVIFTPQLCK